MTVERDYGDVVKMVSELIIECAKRKMCSGAVIQGLLDSVVNLSVPNLGCADTCLILLNAQMRVVQHAKGSEVVSEEVSGEVSGEVRVVH